MKEHERFPDESNDSIFEPELSGLSEAAEQDPEELADEFLRDVEPPSDPDEESSEDELREISTEIRHRWNIYGVAGVKGATHEDLIQVWHEMDMNTYLMDDLLFFVLDHKQKTLANPYTKVTFKDLQERSVAVGNPYQIRTKLVENITPNLVKFGFREHSAYRWAQHGPDPQTQVVRRLGWLLDQPFMREFHLILQSEEAAQGSDLKIAKIVGQATKEVRRQLKVHKSNEQKKKLNPTISYELDLYREVEKTLENALNMCEIVFLGKNK